jgi:hypothetical protein
MKWAWPFAVGLMSVPALASAQGTGAGADGLAVSGTVRLRYEAVQGQLRPGFNRNDDLFGVRTTVHADYASGSVHVVGEIFDSRSYGADARTPISTNEVNAFEVVQAYAGVKLGLGDDGHQLIIDAGRMMVNIGSRRLVAADDFRNTTNSYTGLRADFSAAGGWKGTLIYVLPQIRRPDDNAGLRNNKVEVDRESFDLVLWGGTVAHARTLGSFGADVSFYHLGEDDAPGRPNRNRSLDTFGGRLFRDPSVGSWDLEVEGFGQRGTIRESLSPTAPRLNVRAWYIHADAGYTLDAPWHPRVSVDYDQASGDGRGSRFSRFDTLFGMRRADFTPAGLFSGIGRANILAPGLRLEVTPNKKLDGFVSYRPMWLDNRFDSFSTTGVRDPSGRAGRFAGHQLDSRLRFWLRPERLRFEVDGLLVANGRFLDEAPNGPPGKHAEYVTLNVTAWF